MNELEALGCLSLILMIGLLVFLILFFIMDTLEINYIVKQSSFYKNYIKKEKERIRRRRIEEEEWWEDFWKMKK